MGCGQEAAGAEVEAGEEVVERSGDGGAGQAAAAEAAQASAEAAPELTTEAAPAAAVAQAAAAAVAAALASAAPVVGQEAASAELAAAVITALPQATPPTASPSRLGMLYGETDEAYTERLRDRDPGRLALQEHQDLYSRFKWTAGPAERWQGGVWKEAQDAIERRFWTRRAEACCSPAEMAECRG